MIDEEKQDQLIAHMLGALEAAEARALDAELATDAELRQFADEMREATATLAHTAPLHRPPPHLRATVLAAARGETPPDSSPARRQPGPKAFHLPGWLPWAVAAGIAIGAGMQVATHEQRRAENVSLRAQIQARGREAGLLRARNAELEAEQQALTATQQKLAQELDTWQKRDALSEVRIATLSAQVAALSKAVAVIVWDAEQQRGIVKLSNVPKASAGKDYQLWVIDSKYPTPVSAGVVTVGAGGTGYTSFSPAQPISAANKFAISVERTGGAPAPAGPIIFIGD